MNSRLLAASAAVMLFASAQATADIKDPPLHVAPGGVDSGDCLDAGRPCGSIDFALQRVGKNGRIEIARGDYTLRDADNVFYLLSNAIEVRAEPGTTLIGVPQEFAGQLGQRGFRVIVDAKGLDSETRESLLASRAAVQTTTQATVCAGGNAGGFPCDQVDLLGRASDRTPADRGADVWGFLDLNTHREYAIMGYSSGTAVYDVTDPEDPREIGFIDGQVTTWRDIKVYQFWNNGAQRFDAYAYVTADSASDGLFIIDLTELPQRISRVNNPSDFISAHNVYLSKADFSTGLPLTNDVPVLVIAGSNQQDGRFRNYLLDDPRAPTFVSAPATPPGQPSGNRLYMHDGASMVVTDARMNTQCVNTTTYCDIVFDFNESSLDIWDNTDPANPVRLSRTTYTSTGYTHSGWWSEDGQYVFLQDELDERDRGLATTLRVFSIADLTNPSLVATWTGPTSAIDHNGFARGNRYYMSNYARGLTILDITNPASPSEVGRFDSYPSGDATGFPGAWGTYPFLPSGNILISDIDSGLYVVSDRTLDVPQGTLSFSAESFSADETQTANIVVERNGGSSGAISVAWEVIAGNASKTDVSVVSGVLDWADGDAASKTISLPVSNDGAVEGLEKLLVRLASPTAGATLSAPSMTSLYIGDPGDTPTIEFAESQLSVPERGFNTAVVTVHRGGSASGALSVDWFISAGDITAGTDLELPDNGTLNWGDGDALPKTIEIQIIDDGAVEDDEFFEVSLANPVGGSLTSTVPLRVNVLDGTGINTAPNSIAGSNQTVDGGTTVTLDGTRSNDPEGDSLTYLWTQTAGPSVLLSNADAATASFTAPSVTSATILRFSLEVTDPRGLSNSSTVTVTVRAPNSPLSGGGAFSLWLLVLLLLFERVRSNNRLFAIRTR